MGGGCTHCHGVEELKPGVAVWACDQWPSYKTSPDMPNPAGVNVP